MQVLSSRLLHEYELARQQSDRRTVQVERGIRIVDIAAGGDTDSTAGIHIICDSKGRPKSLPEKYRRHFDLSAAQ